MSHALAARHLLLQQRIALFAQAITLAFDVEDHRVMQQAIENGGSDDAVASQDVAPFGERFVARQDDAARFVTPRDHLKQVVRAGLVERHIADFINDQQRDLGQCLQARRE